MKSFALLSLFIILTNICLNAQKAKFFRYEFTEFDTVKNVEQWKQKKLSSDFEIFENKRRKAKAISASKSWEHLEYKFKYKDIPIEHARLKVHLKDGKIKSMNGEYFEDIRIETKPEISENQALSSAINYINAEEYSWESKDKDFFEYIGKKEFTKKPVGEIVLCQDYFNKSNKGELRLAYKFNIYATKPLTGGMIYVDAINAKVLYLDPMIKNVSGTATTRYSGNVRISTNYYNGSYRLRDYSRGNGIITYNMQRGTNYSNAVDFTDYDNNWTYSEHHNSAKDDAALDAHWGAMITYDYFKNTHSRNSIDGNGMQIKNYVHYSSNYDNAFWSNSLKVMTYGDGYTKFHPLTSLDVIAHEIGHGITSCTAGLVYSYESGAINEGFSDVWGACVEEYATNNKQTWLIGEDIMKSGTALRSMSNPKSLNQPDTYRGTYWYTGSGDYGGVHYNSSVLNFWFYLLSVGGYGTNDNGDAYSVQGISIQKAALIAYKALTEYFTPNTNYTTASTLTRDAAMELYGFCSNEVASVIDAWNAVGVNTSLGIPSTLNITETVTAGNDVIYLATDKIEASNTVKSNSTAVYKSGNKIVLKPGFKVEAGANFQAKIEECNSNAQTTLKSASMYNMPISENGSEALSYKEKIPEATLINEDVKIFPNPINRTLTVSMPKFEDVVYVILYNSSGNEIFRENMTSNICNFDISNLSSGIYIIKIIGKTLNKETKIIKK